MKNDLVYVVVEKTLTDHKLSKKCNLVGPIMLHFPDSLHLIYCGNQNFPAKMDNLFQQSDYNRRKLIYLWFLFNRYTREKEISSRLFWGADFDRQC